MKKQVAHFDDIDFSPDGRIILHDKDESFFLLLFYSAFSKEDQLYVWQGLILKEIDPQSCLYKRMGSCS
jgi:hypothetical protein